MALPWILTGLAALSGTVHVWAHYAANKRLVYIAKPLTVTLLLVLVLTATAVPATPRYHAAIAIGLACSIAGDVFLMLPGDRFLPGVASFLLAHLAYLVAFTAGTAFGSPVLLVPYALLGAVTLAAIWRGLGTMKVPVIVYMAVIVAMAWQAMTRMAMVGTTGAVLAAQGATLFVVSDAVLAVNRFRKPIAGAQAMIHATYYGAQILIAWSVLAG